MSPECDTLQTPLVQQNGNSMQDTQQAVISLLCVMLQAKRLQLSRQVQELRFQLGQAQQAKDIASKHHKQDITRQLQKQAADTLARQQARPGPHSLPDVLSRSSLPELAKLHNVHNICITCW